MLKSSHLESGFWNLALTMRTLKWVYECSIFIDNRVLIIASRSMNNSSKHNSFKTFQAEMQGYEQILQLVRLLEECFRFELHCVAVAGAR